MKLPPGYVAGQGVQKPTGYGGFGERMLKSMGWEKGQGLGRNAEGIKEAIQVKKKEDTVGIGGNGSWEWEKKYWEEAYESVRISTQASESSSSDSDGDSSDDDALVTNRDGTLSSASAHELKLLKALSKGPATGRFGGREAKMARIREQEAKLAAKYAASLGLSAATASGAAAAAGGGEVSTAAAPAAAGSDRSDTTATEATGVQGPSTGGVESKKGSKGKRRTKDSEGKKGKRKRGEGDGGEGGKGGSSTVEESRKGQKKEGKKEKKRKGGGADPTVSTAGTAAQQRRDTDREGTAQRPQSPLQSPQPPRQRIVIEPVVASSAPMADFKPTPATGWWGAQRFKSAGCLEGAKKEMEGEAPRQRAAFNESDQERVYMAAHDGQVKRGSKKGLGQSQAVGKVGGVKWSGSRVTFQEEEAEGGQGKAKLPHLHAVGSSTQLAALPAQATSPQGGDPPPGDSSPGSAGGSWREGVKWRKLISKSLQGAAGGELKLKKLQRVVAEAAMEKLRGREWGEVSKEEVCAEVASRVAGSSKFRVEGKVVRLA